MEIDTRAADRRIGYRAVALRERELNASAPFEEAAR
jgi:hypothetical protein